MAYSTQSTYDSHANPLIVRMMDEGMTFIDSFWKWVVESGIKTIVVNGYVYSYEELPDINASSEKHRYLLMTNPLNVIHIHRILRIGAAPEGMKDNAKVITRGQYSWLKERLNLRCRMKGCFDRYTCAFYNIKDEREPWNEVPEDWVSGNEFCDIYLPFI